MNLTCPKCSSAMQPVTYQDITVDRCTSCGGLWFDLMEHRHLRQIAGSEAIDVGARESTAPTGAQTTIDCPKCRTRMVHMRDVDNRAVEYEYCTVCNGLFFDAGEFAQYKDEGFLGSLRAWFARR